MEHELTLQQLTDSVITHGVSAVEPSRIAALASHAARLGANPVLIDIIVDTTAPTPARTRAFGRLIVQLAHHTTSEFTIAA